MRHAQRGASGLYIAVVLILFAAAALAVLALSRSRSQLDQGTQVVANMGTVQAALQAFVAANGRLPCPARPTLDTGDADPDLASATCNYPQGTVPWRSLGLRRDDSLDPWGNRISYRVYTGTAGSLTQVDGTSMVNCDTVEPAPAGATPLVANAGGTCRTTQDTTEGQYATGKGLTLTQFGTAVTSVAYVLVSHGASGQGAYTGSGAQVPTPTSADELANLSATGPFIAKAASGPDVGLTDAAHFDDILVYSQLDTLVRKAGREARDWPDAPPPSYASIKLDAATIGALMGSTPVTGSLGTSSLDFGTATVTGRNSSGNSNLSFTTSGADGIGIGGGNASSGSGEYFRVDFDAKADKFAFTVTNFGITNFSGTPYREQVQVVFYNGSTNLGTVTKQACRAGSTQVASFSIDAVASVGGQFNSVELRPITAYPGFFSSSFFLNELKTCAATDPTCATSLASTSTNCP